MAAMATRWALSRSWDWAIVRLELQTGQAISRCTRPSAFQYVSSVAWSTPSARIRLMTQVVVVALLTNTIEKHFLLFITNLFWVQNRDARYAP